MLPRQNRRISSHTQSVYLAPNPRLTNASLKVLTSCIRGSSLFTHDSARRTGEAETRRSAMLERSEMMLPRSGAHDDRQHRDGPVERVARPDTIPSSGRNHDQLAGRSIPAVQLAFVEGAELDVSVVAERFPLVICVFGAIDTDDPSPTEVRRLVGWIRRRPRLAKTGHRLIAISSEPFIVQARWLEATPDWIVLSDPDLLLARALPLLTIADERSWRYRPTTLITENGQIVRSFQPADEQDPKIVTDWLARHAPLVSRHADRGHRARPR
jgi:hypothetical protein